MRNQGTLVRRGVGRHRAVDWTPADAVISDACDLLQTDFRFLGAELIDMSGDAYEEALPGVAMRFERSI
jgi:hypothetical protein